MQSAANAPKQVVDSDVIFDLIDKARSLAGEVRDRAWLIKGPVPAPAEPVSKGEHAPSDVSERMQGQIHSIIAVLSDSLESLRAFV